MKGHDIVAVVLSLGVLVSSNSLKDHTHNIEGYRNSLQTKKTWTGPFSRYFTTDNEEQGYVNGGSLLSFGSKLKAQEKQDILDSILYAEQIANEKYDRTKYFDQWYKIYFDMLRKTTWTFGPVTFEKYDPQQSHFKLTSTAYALLAPTCTQTQREILNKLLTVWQSLQDFDRRVTCFLSRSGSGTMETNVANFQIMPTIRGQPGEVLVVFGGFYYQAQTTVGRYMSYLWPSNSISLYHSVVVASFRSTRYSNLRNQVRATLGDRARHLVHEINL